jgi:hypothetical protein
MRRRSLDEIVAVHRLMTKVDGPICEVRFIRGTWARPAGNLRGARIVAAKEVVRRALDKLNNPDIVAVGTFKVSCSLGYKSARWIAEIHLIVAGATKEELDKAICSSRRRSGLTGISSLRVKHVKSLGQTVSDVLRHRPQLWHHPWDRNRPSSARPAKVHRAEYHEWALSLRRGVRIVRYGCDRYFNPLKKKPRVVRVKIPKARPYPHWLERHMF